MKKTILTAAIAALALTSAHGAFAFSDTANDPNVTKIEQLQKQGILSGNQDGKYLPKEKMTFAAGITLIAKALDLDFGDKVFVKQPEASDYFTTIGNDAWYSEAFMLAGVNELGLPRDVNPSAVMSREQFAHYLFKAMITKADLAFIEIYKEYKDADDVTAAYADSIQKLLISDIVQLDASQKFYPKQAVTRSEAAAWTHDTLQLLKQHEETTAPGDDEQSNSPIYDPALTTKAINADVNEVTITAQAPNPGYGIQIESIEFEGDQAIIHIVPTYPKPDMMYPQVITDVKVTTYISSSYEPVIKVDTATSPSSASITGNDGTAEGNE
ncbi:hypothetical protein FHS18_001182 [Paenibacillus phyllosphaerae]|uniref:SLH domain-containing protein n=1 Tax=Paenibacillus phyllosphaerae TaxID=274593 RepID=A0A7W5AUQ9_9BACL|nr:S-layer homology domain-containing protein [Paenibacillus phyllosphaerae]MBB3109130.1 hypothetical protein [Paenibacillus phyllosphaerae]